MAQQLAPRIQRGHRRSERKLSKLTSLLQKIKQRQKVVKQLETSFFFQKIKQPQIIYSKGESAYSMEGLKL